MNDKKIQWHPGFVAAMNLEMADDRDALMFHKEYNLNTKPLEIDLLIIKKSSNFSVNNEIGKIFRGHNIIEFKDPADHLDIDVFYKVQGYACLYKSYGETVDAIKEDDITMTLIRAVKPTGLFQYFKKHGYQISSPCHGIYYISGKVLFPAQIIVSKELEPESHIWLKSLSGQLEKYDMQTLLRQIQSLDGKQNREFADSVLEVVMKANTTIVKEMIGDDGMSEELLEIIRPIVEPQILKREEECMNRGLKRGLEQGLEQGLQQGLEQGLQQGLEQGLEQGLQQGLKKGIQGAVCMLRELGHKDFEIKMILQNQYDLSENETEEYL